MRVLVIEDDRRIASVLEKGLKAESYAVDLAYDGEEGEELAAINEYDVIILDIMLPNQDGWQTCENIRNDGIHTPILMLTALDDVNDKIRGLDTGADDYLPKPFHFGELLARLRSLTRRSTEVRTTIIEKFGIQLDLNTHKATREGKEIILTTKEFALLELFMMNPDRILSRYTISEKVWDMNFDPKSNVIDSFIKYLRQKVDRGFSKKLIHTVRGSGYIFSEDSRE
jgi:DNA-binding response OmpR family regulator